MDKTIYIFGHKNPDTDSVVSATAYEALKKAQGFSEYKACRAGKLNPQTEYIYKKFGITPPEFIPDLNPRVAYYMSDKVDMVNQMISFWDAALFMRENNRRVIPVVDDQGHYKAILNYNSFSKNVFDILNPRHHISIFTENSLMKKTLDAQILVEGEVPEELHKYTILSASSKIETFVNTLENHSHERILVVAGDREDIQEICIQKKVSALVLSAGRLPSDRIIEMAKESGTSIIVSKYDTASTSMLILYSTPVRMVCDHNVKPIKTTDSIQKILPMLKEADGQILPVVDEENRVVGVLDEIDIHHEAKISVALVDHNELSQAVDGVENYTICDIVDHHRLGSIRTKMPISFINMPLGSTSTIITKMYREQNIEIPLQVAKLLLCGILSDTLILQSATTTPVDVEIAEFLSEKTGLDYKELGEEI
nr:putative manganese-dependent inorganic diphosphatase [Treponema sp.]